MFDLEKFSKDILNVFRLKFTYRYTWRLVNWEKDSTAAHSWSMTILADYFLDYLEKKSSWKYSLNKIKIYEYIMYHDLIEAETWDIDNSPKYAKKHAQKKYSEDEALEIFSKKIPNYLWEKLTHIFHEYEERNTLESQFVKIIDIFEGQMQCLHDDSLWDDWTEEFYNFRFVDRKEFNSFPELKEIIVQIANQAKEKWYFKI